MNKPAKYMPIWVHRFVHVLSMMVGWVGVPATLLFTIFSPMKDRWGAGPAGFVMFATAIASAWIAARIIAKHLPARCPKCRGRAMYVSSFPPTFRCEQCQAETVLEYD